MLDSENSNSDRESDNKENMICQYCQCHGRVHETGENVGNSPPIYWGIQLDQDLLETLISIYPEWFKGYNLNLDKMTDKSAAGGLDEMQTSPKSQVDENSIQKSMDKNKESLKVKLMLRRPINQLVDQGIMPPPKTPPAYYEERRKLERAKMGDILKHKIQRRPDRQELIQQHILEDSNIDPSLQDRQRQLKKARLADDLNDKLSHRPGPLELVKGNILHVDDTLAQALKDGTINFKKTSEGEIRKHPPRIFVFDEDSNGSELSPQQSPQQGDSDQSQSTSAPSPPECCIIPQLACDIKISTSPSSTQSSSSTQSPSPTDTISMVTAAISSHANVTKSPSSSTSSSSSRRSKKNKAKSQPKTRTIKFHEYKGPPNTQKNNLFHQTMPMESSYELLLKQQQLFLQWQLEWQHKYPQILLPAAQKTESLTNCTTLTTANNALATVTPMDTGQPFQQPTVVNHPQPPTPPPQPPRCLTKLEDMKVSDLKAELKKRNLPVSGSKPQLIERLKPYSEMTIINGSPSSINTLVELPSATSNANILITTTTGTISNGVNAEAALLQNDEATNMSMNLGSPPLSPVSSSDVNNSNSAPVSPENSLDQPFTVNHIKQSQPNFNSPTSVPPTLQQNSRPSSVAPMEVDVSSNVISSNTITNSGFENMEVGDFPAVSFQLSSQSTLHQHHLVRQQQKKIEELERELELSQFQLQQQQMLVQQQQFMVPASTTVTQTNTTSTTDSKMLQKLQLQQHLQQKLQQQQGQKLQQQQTSPQIQTSPQKLQQLQLQQQQVQQQQLHQLQQQHQLQKQMHQQQQAAQKLQQQPEVILTSTGNNNKVKPSITTFFQNQNLNLSSSLPVQQAKVFSLTSAPTSNTHSFSFTSQNSRNKGITALSNGFTANRSVSMPTSPINKNTNPRLVSNSSVTFNKPPPDYNEATKQLKNKQIQLQNNALLNNLPPTGSSVTKSVKSQAVDDVLEILIKQGELPPSAAQEPPPTPKSTVSPTLPTTTQPSLATQNTSLSSELLGKSSVLPFMATSCLSQTLSKESSPPPLLGGISPVTITTDVSLDHSPSSMDLSSLQLDLAFSENNMNTLDLSPFTEMKTKDSDLLTIPSESTNSLHNSEPNLASLDIQDGTQTMDIDVPDVTDVADWLDVIMPSTGLTPLSANAPMSLPDTDITDPMLSHTQDPLDFFNIDEIDFRGSTDLSVLSWDKVDFAT